MHERQPTDLWVLCSEYMPYIVGGLGIVATELSKEYSRLGLRVVVITYSSTGAIKVSCDENITVVRFPKRFRHTSIISYLEREGYALPKAAHVHSLQYLALANYLVRLGVPTLYTCHSLVIKRSRNKVFTPGRQARLLKTVDKVVVPSTSEYNRLLLRYPSCVGKAVVIAHGVRVPDLSTVNSYPYCLLYAGRLVHNKGLEQLIDAVGVLRKEYPHVQLYVIGRGGPDYERQLKVRARHKKVANRIHWLGYFRHEELLRVYGLFSAVVMPSRSESFGLVALETLACGVPLISTQAGGLRDFVNDDVAQVIPRVSATTVASAISATWDNSRTTHRRVAAGQRLAHEYSWSKSALRYTQVFSRLLRAKKGVNSNVF